MSNRTYNASLRHEKAANTKRQILNAAKALFESTGFANVTIDQIAARAHVSAPSVYGLFKSKRGLLLALMDSAFSEEKRQSLVKEVMLSASPERRLELAATLSRQIYDAEKAELSLLRGAFILDPTLKDLEAEREERRYERQKETAELLATEGARDILWALTGRDLYRLLVIERNWSSDRYEAWLAKTLKATL